MSSGQNCGSSSVEVGIRAWRDSAGTMWEGLVGYTQGFLYLS